MRKKRDTYDQYLYLLNRRRHIRRVWSRHGSYFGETWLTQKTHTRLICRRSTPKTGTT